MVTYPKYTPRFPKKMWTLPCILEHQAQHIPDRPFLQWTGEGRSHSFSEVNQQVNRFAHGMRNLGIAKADRVVIFMPNCLSSSFL